MLYLLLWFPRRTEPVATGEMIILRRIAFGNSLIVALDPQTTRLSLLVSSAPPTTTLEIPSNEIPSNEQLINPSSPTTMGWGALEFETVVNEFDGFYYKLIKKKNWSIIEKFIIAHIFFFFTLRNCNEWGEEKYYFRLGSIMANFPVLH